MDEVSKLIGIINTGDYEGDIFVGRQYVEVYHDEAYTYFEHPRFMDEDTGEYSDYLTLAVGIDNTDDHTITDNRNPINTTGTLLETVTIYVEMVTMGEFIHFKDLLGHTTF
jgi:hypothetical protein